jgi:hypothetical protein
LEVGGEGGEDEKSGVNYVTYILYEKRVTRVWCDETELQ